MSNLTSEVKPFDTHEHLKNSVHRGLTSVPKFLCSSCFYDHQGSIIFERICRLPEYYLTRTETEILREKSDEITSEIPEQAVIAELGNGSSAKIRLLLDFLFRQRESVRYVPIDISYRHMKKSVADLRESYPRLSITPIGGRYEDGLALLRESLLPKAVIWFGSSIGNMNDDEAVSFLSHIGEMMGAGDCLIIGMDMVKDWAIIRKAYDDSQGVTAEFNMNILRRMNRELNADFDISKFRHAPVCNRECSRMESYIASCEDQKVFIKSLDLRIFIRKKERIHVEVSCKYSPDKIKTMANKAGLRLENQWLDGKKWFSLNLFKKAGD